MFIQHLASIYHILQTGSGQQILDSQVESTKIHPNTSFKQNVYIKFEKKVVL